MLGEGEANAGEVALSDDGVADAGGERGEELAEAIGLPVETSDDLMEIDYGDWTGTSFAALREDPRWAAWNYAKGVGRPPGGESLLEIQARMRRFVDHACARHPEQRIAAVGHGEPIKAILAHAIGAPLDNLDRFDLDPASVSVLAAGDWGMKVIRINEACS